MEINVDRHQNEFRKQGWQFGRESLTSEIIALKSFLEIHINRIIHNSLYGLAHYHASILIFHLIIYRNNSHTEKSSGVSTLPAVIQIEINRKTLINYILLETERLLR